MNTNSTQKRSIKDFFQSLSRHIPLSGSWMISYLVILILPLIISQLFYRQSVRLSEQNAAEMCDAVLEQTLLTVDRSMEDVRAAGRELLTRDEVLSIQYSSQINTVKRIKISQLNKALSLKVNFHQGIDKIAMIFIESGVCTSTEGFYDSEAIARQQFSSVWGLDYDEIKTLSVEEEGDFHILLIGGEGDTRATGLYAVMDMEAVGNLPRVILVFKLNLSYFRSLLAAEDSSGSPVVWAVSDNGLIISPSGIDPDRMQQLIDQTAPYLSSGRRQDAIRDQQLVLSSAESGMAGWKMISATSTAFYSEKLGAIRRWYLAYLALCLGVGIILSTLFAKKNYSPIKRLSDLLQGNKPGAQDSAFSESSGVFEQIEENLSRLIQKEQDYEREIDRQKKSLLSSSLVRTMKGTLYSEEAFRMACTDYGLKFEGKRFAAVGILIRDWHNLFFDGKAANDEKTQELAQYVTISVTEELIRESFTGYLCAADGRIYAVLSVPDEMSEKEYQEKIWGICAKAESFIRERLGLLLCYYMSGLYDSEEGTAPESIRRSYEEVQWGLEQVIGFDRPDALASRDTLHSQLESSFDPDFSAFALKRRQYIADVGAGDIEEADRLYRELRQEGIFQLERSFSAIRVQTMGLYDLLMSSLLSSRQLTEHTETLSAISLAMNKASDLHDLEKLIHQAEEVVYSLCRPADETKEESYSVRVARYVGENYMDPELSVASVAEYLGVSQSYLLRAFKKEGSGCSVSDYIHRRRVNEAKILLKTTDETVGDIAQKVGYGNSLALIRAFKRLEDGKTPTEYRTSHSEKVSE